MDDLSRVRELCQGEEDMMVSIQGVPSDESILVQLFRENLV